MKSTITLAMMAHNEARYLPRVQENLGDRINSVIIISDPPNDDGTIEVAKEVFNQYNTKIIERPWPTDKNAASTARNQILLIARSMGDDYVLWLDPDSPFVGTIPDELDAPLYALLTVDIKPNISWWQPHIIRSDQSLRWVGRIHEYLDTGQSPVVCLNTGHIARDGSGGGRDRWINFDLPVLLEEVAERPNDPRAINYLAQTYRDLEDYDNAIIWYKKRATTFGMDQETFYAHYMVGICYLIKGDTEQAEHWFLKAYAFRPSRTEPAKRLVELYQQKGEYILAMEMMKNVHATPPTNDVLLVQDRVVVK